MNDIDNVDQSKPWMAWVCAPFAIAIAYAATNPVIFWLLQPIYSVDPLAVPAIIITLAIYAMFVRRLLRLRDEGRIGFGLTAFNAGGFLLSGVLAIKLAIAGGLWFCFGIFALYYLAMAGMAYVAGGCYGWLIGMVYRSFRAWRTPRVITLGCGPTRIRTPSCRKRRTDQIYLP